MIAFWEPKAGSSPSDWEDGVAYSVHAGRFAVADGASTGSRSREWAFALVKGAFNQASRLNLASDSDIDFRNWVGTVRREFDPNGAEFSSTQTPSWVRDASRRSGSFATLLAGDIDDRYLAALAVGDCCLFVVPSSGAIRSFPGQSPTDFGSMPELIASLDDHAVPDPVRYSTALNVDDTVFVATDALSAYLVRFITDRGVWRELTTITSLDFHRFILDLRNTKLIKNDDVTLLRILRACP